ncbi:hypothetical protein [Streptomyces sp. UH6]|uniref:hypothetical protein n=1 Tax=Streptomyces sp. UH6 TaxID=2748379 RepID=UPI0015D51FE0|nr:hypothetical protein [Streptomyces sp. UH6]NYV73651.1 hypothetical protein [Streptomyces sp. UH6]
MRVQVVRVPEIPHAGRAYLDGESGERGAVVVWVQEDLVTDEEAQRLEHVLSRAAQGVLAQGGQPA